MAHLKHSQPRMGLSLEEPYAAVQLIGDRLFLILGRKFANEGRVVGTNESNIGIFAVAKSGLTIT